MNNEKFTKGPWRISTHNTPGCGEYETIESEISSERIIDGEWYSSLSTNNDSDIYLIAAAPAMYAEIKRDIAYLERQMKFKTDNDEMLPMLKQERERKVEILAKARGES